MSDNQKDLIETWRGIIVGEGKSWVLFSHGTCVILTGQTTDLEQQATQLLREWGPVVVGTPSADFDVIELRDDPGWVVTCHHPDILTYVGRDEFEGPTPPDDIFIGLAGRSRRGQDADELQVVHIEVAE